MQIFTNGEILLLKYVYNNHIVWFLTPVAHHTQFLTIYSQHSAFVKGKGVQ